MRWKAIIIGASALAALAFGLGTQPKTQQPVIHELLSAPSGG
jgi:hypothetical protein